MGAVVLTSTAAPTATAALDCRTEVGEVRATCSWKRTRLPYCQAHQGLSSASAASLPVQVVTPASRIHNSPFAGCSHGRGVGLGRGRVSSSSFASMGTGQNQNTKQNSIVCADCDGNGAVQCSQCKGTGVNSVDHFNGQFKAGQLCWLCRGKREILCGNCNGAGFIGGFMSTFDE